MKIKRKLYTKSQSNQEETPQITSKDLQFEQGRLQRELMKTQRLRQKMQQEERQNDAKRLMQLQKMEQKKDMEEDKARIRIKKMEDDKEEKTSLYKSKPHLVAPVPMK